MRTEVRSLLIYRDRGHRKQEEIFLGENKINSVHEPIKKKFGEQPLSLGFHFNCTILKQILEEQGWRCGLDSSGSGLVSVACCFEHENEQLGIL